VKRGAFGAPFAAAAAMGDAAFAGECVVATVAGLATLATFIAASAAGLSSTDFICPRVAMTQSVSPKDTCDTRP